MPVTPLRSIHVVTANLRFELCSVFCRPTEETMGFPGVCKVGTPCMRRKVTTIFVRCAADAESYVEPLQTPGRKFPLVDLF